MKSHTGAASQSYASAQCSYLSSPSPGQVSILLLKIAGTRKREWSGAVKPSPIQAQQQQLAMEMDCPPSPGEFWHGQGTQYRAR